MTAVSPGDAWAVGSTRTRALVMRWHGGHWRPVKLKASLADGLSPIDVAASSASNVWVFGSDINSGAGRAMRWNGSGWAPVLLPAGATTDSAAVLSPSDVWITSSVGSCVGGQCSTTLYQWNGSQWSPYPVNAQIDQVSAAGPGNVWAVGEDFINESTYTFSPVAYRWNGASWDQVTSMPHPRAGGTTGIDVVSSHDVWTSFFLARNSKVVALRWNGRRWLRLTAPNSVGASPEPLQVGRSVWFGPWALWNGRHWRAVGPGSLIPPGGGGANILGIATVPGRSAVWGVGQISRTPNSNIADSLVGVYGPTP